MISDEPAEDADNLNDDHLLTTYLAGSAPKPETAAALVHSDWPPPAMQDLGLNVDPATLRWFETHHCDWRQEMCSVLRAWVDMRTRDPDGSMTQPRLS
jgi:hypothetical protein